MFVEFGNICLSTAWYSVWWRDTTLISWDLFTEGAYLVVTEIISLFLDFHASWFLVSYIIYRSEEVICHWWWLWWSLIFVLIFGSHRIFFPFLYSTPLVPALKSAILSLRTRLSYKSIEFRRVAGKPFDPPLASLQLLSLLYWVTWLRG